jgi:predicted ATPase
MRKLTVKNFSVIKDAELEFGKITVLIGPQSSGKSLLCKLAYFFGQIVPEAVNGLLLLRMSLTQLQEVPQRSMGATRL